MNLSIFPSTIRPVIKVIGLGGFGSKAVNHIIANEKENIENIVISANEKDLLHSSSLRRILIGKNKTNKNGCGGDPSLAKEIAINEKDLISSFFIKTDIVIIIAGLGKGCGTGMSPIISELASYFGINIIGIYSLPFKHEGQMCRIYANNAIHANSRYSKNIITIENKRILRLVEAGRPTAEALNNVFEAIKVMIDGILRYYCHSSSTPRSPIDNNPLSLEKYVFYMLSRNFINDPLLSIHANIFWDSVLNHHPHN